MGLIQDTGDIFIGIGDPFFSRNNKDDHICFVHGDFCLMLDLLHKWGIYVINPPCINDTKFSIQPLSCCINAVTSDSFYILNDGNPLTGNPVKERRFSDIGTAYNRNSW